MQEGRPFALEIGVERVELEVFAGTIFMRKEFQSLIDVIVRDDHDAVIELLRKDRTLAVATMRANRYEPEIIHWLYAGDTALHVAAAGYRVEIAKTLLDASADVSAAKNRRRSQPLHYASDGHCDSPAWNPQRQVSILRLLLRSGANVQAQDKNGATPLHRATRTRCAAAVSCLLAAGADAKTLNNPGSTAFHLAVQNTGRGGSGGEQAKAAQAEIIRAFLDRGISPSLKDAKGKSVVDWARSDWLRQLLA